MKMDGAHPSSQGALSHFKFYIVAKARRTNVRFCQPLKLKNEPSVESPFLMIINLMTLVRTLANSMIFAVPRKAKMQASPFTRTIKGL